MHTATRPVSSSPARLSVDSASADSASVMKAAGDRVAEDTASRPKRSTPAGSEKIRVAVAGATGYTGQELLRLLSRHPGVVVTRATSSGASTRRLPALAGLWNGVVTPLEPETLASDADVVFLALPDTAAAELAPRLIDADVRV